MEARDVETIILALNTLGSFDFTGHMLNELNRECAVVYLEDDLPEIRKAAAVTCCQLLVRDPVCYQTSDNAMSIVGEVLEKLLTVGITDPGNCISFLHFLINLVMDFLGAILDLSLFFGFAWNLDPSIRQTVLSSLDERFDHHLAAAENVRSLFIALNDEVFSIRELAISIIGRLTIHNPAYVMPSLRKTLIQLMTELEYSSVRYKFLDYFWLRRERGGKDFIPDFYSRCSIIYK